MATKPKIRFAATVDGRAVELFSILDRGAEGIVIIPAHPKFFGDNPHDLIAFSDQHYSVHPTKGIDTTITQKTKLQDGTSISNIAYIHDTNKSLLWPIFSRRMPIFQGNNRELKNKPKDKSYFIGSFETSISTFLYSVFIADTRFDPNMVIDKNFNICAVKVNDYAIIAFSTYLPLPSLMEGDVAGWATSSQVMNSQRSKNHLQIHVESIPHEFIVPAHWALMDILSKRFRERLEPLLVHQSKEVLALISIALTAFKDVPFKKAE